MKKFSSIGTFLAPRFSDATVTDALDAIHIGFKSLIGDAVAMLPAIVCQEWLYWFSDSLSPLPLPIPPPPSPCSSTWKISKHRDKETTTEYTVIFSRSSQHKEIQRLLQLFAHKCPDFIQFLTTRSTSIGRTYIQDLKRLQQSKYLAKN